METAALKLFESLDNYSKIEELIKEGESEGMFLECKSPLEPLLDKKKKIKLATTLSGFSNTEGGIVIWGVSTTKHDHSGLDILTQIEEIGNCDYFSKQIERSIPTLTTPSITTCLNKVIKKSKGDSRGLVITYVPKTLGDPVQSNIDNNFYFRNGDEFTILPYEMLKRLFASTESPDLHIIFNSEIVKNKGNGMWEIPIIIKNDSSAVAEHTNVFVQIENEEDCDSISSRNLLDSSDVNPGKRLFNKELEAVVHRGFNSIVGSLNIKMKLEKRYKRTLKLKIRIFANKMRGIEEEMSIYLFQNGVSVKKTGEEYIY